jgi:hypothetical protein
MKKILFISRKAEYCGVNDYGKRVNKILQQSKLFEIKFAEIETSNEYSDIFNEYQPDLVLYNYYPTILPFITNDFLHMVRQIPHVVIFHEVGLLFTPDAILDVDSTKEDNPSQNYYSLPRPLFEDIKLKDFEANDVPTIGSFGFGFTDKNFPRIATLVCEQFDRAKIRLNIPFATFGDSNGDIAKAEVEKIRQIINNSGKEIQLEISHDFLEHIDLLNFLKQNDVNMFLYQKHETRNLSSTIDYALSVKKPIAISDSYMFRHINKSTPSILVDNMSIKDIIANGIKPLEPLYSIYSNKNVLEKYELILNKLLNK